MGRDSDRDVPPYQPNKDKRMAEWRAKKKREKEQADAENSEKVQEAASEEKKKEVEKEERRELPGPVTAQPITNEGGIEISPMQPPGGILKKQRRPRKQHFDLGHTPAPSLFDEVE